MNDEQLADFLAGKMPPAEAEALLRDPATCAEIEAQLQLNAALAAQLGGARDEARVQAAVLALLRASDEAEVCASVAGELRVVPFPFRRVALALAACFAVLASAWWLMRKPPEPAPEIAERSTPAPFITGVEIATDNRFRDPAVWPFDANSPWNLPLGDGARYEAAEPAEFARMPVELRPRRVVIADPRFPSIVLRSADGDTAEVHALPHMLRPGSGPHPTVIVSPSRREAVEYFNISPQQDSEWFVQGLARIDLRGSGHWPDARGIGEASFPAVAGLVREGEWQRGIRHALAISVPVDLLNGAEPEQWPAHLRLAKRARSFTGRGNLRLGTLLALPPEVKPENLGIAAGTPEMSLARALQDYGAYISGGTEPQTPLHLFNADIVVKTLDPAAVTRLVEKLMIVANNSADTPGGGGARRRDLAPALRIAQLAMPRDPLLARR